MADNNSNSKSSGIGFCGLLAIVFITLKLTHYIKWSWLWVLCPLWIPVAIFIVIVLLGAIIVGIKTLIDKIIMWKRKKNGVKGRKQEITYFTHKWL